MSNGTRALTLVLDTIGIGIFVGTVEVTFATTIDAREQPVASALLAALYYLVFEAASGRTPAKFLLGTRVVNQHGHAPTLGQILIRTASRFVPFDALTFLGRAPGWHDRWSETRVVWTKKRSRRGEDADDE